ncbi:hypothetical protein LVJ94_18755 [Pendulispora rubella]|uniref:Uncharacterized protein n=1 Tax=Pendulispora rubella TaxID=2741070 RepID=A0ABZ2LEA5_9BACT
MAIEDGAFPQAYAALDAWEKAATVSANAWVRAYPFTSRLDLDLELGELEAARHTARAFIAASQTWLPEDTWDMPTERSRALYFTAQIGRDEFRRLQARDAEGIAARGGFYAPAGVRWIESYALSIRDVEDARFALSKLPDERPLLDAAFRDFFVDAEIGRIHLYAGRLDRALEWLHRAANSCLYVRALHSVQAHAWYGHALAKNGQRLEACHEYAYVLQRWGREPRSRSANAAREGALRLGCAEVSPRSIGTTK